MKVICLIFLTSFLSIVSVAQTNVDQLIEDLYDVWDGIYTNYYFNHLSGDINKSYLFFQTPLVDSNVSSSNQLKSQIKFAESEMIRKDWGLDWNSGYAINTASGIGESDDLIYRSRVQSELSWNILNNGFVENKTRSDIRNNEGRMLALLAEEEGSATDIFVNWHKIIYHFNKSKIEILEQRLELAKKRVDIAYQLNSVSLVKQDELLKNLESFAEVKSLLNIYEDYNKEVSGFEDELISTDFPLIDINYKYVLQSLEETKNDSLIALELANLDLMNKPIQDVSLRAYSRYNYYDLITAAGNRSFFTFGLSLGIPLVFDKKETENLIQLKRTQIEDIQPENDVNVQKDVLGYFYEFRYKLKQFNNFYYKNMMLKELLRKEQARYRVNTLDFNPLKALRLLDEKMSIDIELLDLKQQMYLYILRIQDASPFLKIEEIIKPITLEEIEIKESANIPTEVYIWSKTLKEYEIDFLVNYLVLYKVTKVVLSTGGDNLLLNQFINAVSQEGIAVELMIGDNNLINNIDNESIPSKLAGIETSKVSGLHLDVEPHTFDDWKDNKANYMAKYLTMLTAVKTYTNAHNLKLSVSIPTHYPQEDVTEIFNKVDLVYFMCYENVKTDFIARKIGFYNMNKTVVALRTEDFNDRIAIQAKIKELDSAVNPDTFIIHDLGRLIKLAE